MYHSNKRNRRKKGSGMLWIWITFLILFLVITAISAVLAATGTLDTLLPLFESDSKNNSISTNTSDSASVSDPSTSSSSQSSSEPQGHSSDDPESSEPVSSQPPTIQLSTPSFSRPSEMQGVILQAGVDFEVGENLTQQQSRDQINAAIEQVQSLTMNTVILDPATEDGFLFADTLAQEEGYDPFSAMISSARAAGMYVYAIYDLRLAADGSLVDAAFISNAVQGCADFADRYDLDGVLLTGYYTSETLDGYQQYLSEGSGIGYENYLYESTGQLLRLAAQTMRENASHLQIGVLADPVWANADAMPEGSQTSASFQSYLDGYVDLRTMTEQGLFDFLAVKALENTDDPQTPFTAVASWWTELAEQNDLPCYLVQDSGETMTSAQQLTEQVIEAKKLSGYTGSIYTALSGLNSSVLIDYLNDNIQEEFILKKLAVTKPTQMQFSTYEPSVVFTGAASPAFAVTINGEAIDTDDSGYFSVTLPLEIGTNTFTIAQEDQAYTYTITRQIQIFDGEISPSGAVNVDGGMQITITANVYEEAEVYAVIGGTTIPMAIRETDDDDTDRDSSYPVFSGIYTAPAATSSAQNLGAVTVYASWNGFSESRQGASITVNKKKILQDGVLAEVVSTSAETYPSNVLNHLSQSGYYDLPQGTMDYIVGDEVIYKADGKTYRYFNMASGLRIATEDLATVSTIDSIEENIIGGMEITGDDRYTTIRLATLYKVPFSVKYDKSTVKFTFHYTSVTPEGLSLPDSRLFSSAQWDSNVLTLTLNTQGGFMGFTSWYDGDILVLQFNNPAMVSSSGGLGGTRIVVDPGHSVTDPGALGFHPSYPEQVINYGIARQLKSILQDWGASVLMIDTQSSSVSLQSRVAQAAEYEPHLFVSVHNNSATDSSTKGTEVYYFNAFSSSLASKVSSGISSAFGTTNRGAKFGRYYVTRTNQFPAILAECGFVSNQSEYEKLLSKSEQYNIAEGIANGIYNYLVETGGSNRGEDFTLTSGSMEKPGQASGSAGGSNEGDTGNSEDTVERDPNAIVTDVNLKEEEDISLTVGESYQLTLLVTPEEATGNEDVRWESFDDSIVTVDQDGVVTAVAPGRGRVRVITTDGKYGDNCYFNVTEASSDDDTDDGEGEGESTSGAPLSLELDIQWMQLAVGEQYPLIATITPSQSDTDLSLRWSSSDEEVLTVDEDGTVTAVGEGTATITVRISGAMRPVATCEFEVVSS